MPARNEPALHGRRVAQTQVRTTFGAELLAGRLDAAISQRTAGAAADMSHTQFGRIERGQSPQTHSRYKLARAAAAVGLRITLKTYPDGDPARDAGHLGLAERFHRRLPPRDRLANGGAAPDPRRPPCVGWRCDPCSDEQLAANWKRDSATSRRSNAASTLKQRDGAARRGDPRDRDTKHNRRMLDLSSRCTSGDSSPSTVGRSPSLLLLATSSRIAPQPPNRSPIASNPRTIPRSARHASSRASGERSARCCVGVRMAHVGAERATRSAGVAPLSASGRNSAGNCLSSASGGVSQETAGARCRHVAGPIRAESSEERFGASLSTRLHEPPPRSGCDSRSRRTPTEILPGMPRTLRSAERFRRRLPRAPSGAPRCPSRSPATIERGTASPRSRRGALGRSSKRDSTTSRRSNGG